MSSPLDILKQYWGHSQFRSLQEDIITSVLEGKDTLALLPTGGGKSVCFQVPALLLPGICIVISPLIALMKDQVEQLKRRGIPALSIHAGMSFIEVRKTLENAAYGNFRFLYVSPERLETPLFLEYLPALNTSLIAIDEAHCVSQWGYDFRPSYLRIAALRGHLPTVPMIALTASATPQVQEDITGKLLFRPGYRQFSQPFTRPGLSYSVFHIESRQSKLLEIVNNVKGSGIVYCKTRKQTQDVADLLMLHGISAACYHAGLNNDTRTARQEAWLQNRTRIIACTNAFGMGIDKPDVRVVIHYQAPDCIEHYYQEAGRAGRDGKRAYAVLLYDERELTEMAAQTDIRFPGPEVVKAVYRALMNCLQIPAGTGEGMSFNFDIAAFATNFKFNILTATYAVKAMEQEGLLTFNEVFFKPATLVFTTSKNGLYDFEHSFPEYDPLIKALLRSYNGIFDFPTAVYEIKLAKHTQINLATLRQQLQELHQHGIVEYTPQKDAPQVVLLRNRSHSDDFHFNNAAYYQRKQVYAERAAAMITYIRTTNSCRNNMIDHYFGGTISTVCGICDNCINQHARTAGNDDFEIYHTQIMQGIAAGPVHIEQLLQRLNNTNREKFWNVMNYLIAEKKVMIDRGGMVNSIG